MNRLLAIAVSLPCAAFAQSGVLPYSKNTKLVISSCGPVHIVGEARPDAAYTITGRRGQVQVIARQGEAATRKFWLKAMEPGATAMLEMKVPRGLAIVIETTGGDVEAIDIEGTVTAKTDWGRVTVDRLSNGAVIQTGGGDVRIGRVAGEVKCYSRAGSITADSLHGGHLQTDGGEILVRESTAPVVVKTGGGNVRLLHAKAGVDATTAGGVVDIQWSDGPVIASTRGGSIQVGGAKGVQCDTGNGAVRLKNVSGKLNALTGAGTILAELPSNSPLEDSRLKTAAGDVILMIPSNLSVTVKAAGRKVISDFPGIRGETTAYGELQGGGPLVLVEAPGGTVFLRKKH